MVARKPRKGKTTAMRLMARSRMELRGLTIVAGWAELSDVAGSGMAPVGVIGEAEWVGGRVITGSFRITRRKTYALMKAKPAVASMTGDWFKLSGDLVNVEARRPFGDAEEAAFSDLMIGRHLPAFDRGIVESAATGNAPPIAAVGIVADSPTSDFVARFTSDGRLNLFR